MNTPTTAPPPARLLIVDDEAEQLRALCTVLGDEGHAITGCATPDEALHLLRGGARFDVLLSDLHLPGIDGIELMRQALATDADLVPVLMTGQGTIDTAVEAMKVGALDYVLKPFKLAAMKPVLARAIEVRRLRQDRRRLQDDVLKRTQALEAANRELDAFATRIAHDLRGPLLGMLGFARIVHERSVDRLADQELGYLARIVAAGERAERMVRDLLAFARLGDDPLNRRRVALDGVMARARASAELQAQGRTVRWQVGPLPTVTGDPSLLEMVFLNLLSNAVKYTAPREDAFVEVGHDPLPEGGHRIWVRDNGVGFDPDYADRLFSPFQRLHPADQFEGNGIGLANVRRIIERHGGGVGASSRPGEGATFSVTLPG